VKCVFGLLFLHIYCVHISFLEVGGKVSKLLKLIIKKKKSFLKLNSFCIAPRKLSLKYDNLIVIVDPYQCWYIISGSYQKETKKKKIILNVQGFILWVQIGWFNKKKLNNFLRQSNNPKRDITRINLRIECKNGS